MQAAISQLFNLSGKTALVTGASRGLGQAIAVALSAAGARVLCASSSAGGADETVKQILDAGGQAEAFAADLSNPDAVRQLATKALAAAKTIDILVNCGGTIFRSPALEFPQAQWQQNFAVNVDSAFLLSQLLAKPMIERGFGKIINIASMLSFSGGITVPAYTASKHAIAGQILARLPAGRWGEPEDLAGAVVFLASSASNYVNGHILAVDGGWLAR